MSQSGIGARAESNAVAWVLCATAALTALVHIAVLAVRAVHMLEKGALFEMTGAEVAPIYGVWKARHSYPVYENPFGDRFYFALYNWAFYYAYGLIARLAEWDGDALVRNARLLTCSLGLVGAALFAVLLGTLTRLSFRHLRNFLYVTSVALVTWFSSSAWSWFALSVRADMASMICAMGGLACYLRSLSKPSRMVLLSAGLSFSAAWAFKQSTVGIFVGVCLHALLRDRNIRGATLVAVPVVVTASLSLLLGGRLYRLNALTLPTVTQFDHLRVAWLQLVQVLATHVYLWLVPLLWILVVARSGVRLEARERSAVTALAWSAAASFCWCLVALNRNGSYTNTLLESFLTASLLALVLMTIACRTMAAGGATWPVVVMLLCLLEAGAFPAAQLIWPDRVGNQTVAQPAEYAAMRQLAVSMDVVPKPIFVEEGMLSLPWYSTANRYPAVVLDNYLYFLVRAAGRVPPGEGLEQLIEGHRFPALLLTGVMRLDSVARQAGYRPQSLPASTGTRFTLYTTANGSQARNTYSDDLSPAASTCGAVATFADRKTPTEIRHRIFNVGTNTNTRSFSLVRNLWYAHDEPAASSPHISRFEGTHARSLVGTSPDFVNAASGDFHLSAGSVARSAGSVSFAPRSDFAGKCYARPSSLGALELTAAASGAAAAAARSSIANQ